MVITTRIMVIYSQSAVSPLWLLSVHHERDPSKHHCKHLRRKFTEASFSEYVRKWKEVENMVVLSGLGSTDVVLCDSLERSHFLAVSTYMRAKFNTEFCVGFQVGIWRI
jgi:hypothetical protein